MILRIFVISTALLLSTTASFSETINLRNFCQRWEFVPANVALKSPIAALLQCTKDEQTWLSIQIKCFSDTAEIEFRYRPGYPIAAPVPRTAQADLQTLNTPTETTSALNDQATEPEVVPLAEKEMLFFDFPKLGVTSVVAYDFDAKDWHYTEKEPLATLFGSLIKGNYADVSMMAMDVTERIPLRGSTKAIGRVVETCRIAKRKIEKDAKKLATQTQN
jgi:hypothetical protein